jgi:hypothetical protein
MEERGFHVFYNILLLLEGLIEGGCDWLDVYQEAATFWSENLVLVM